MKTEKPISPLSEDEKEEDQEESHAIDDNPMIISKQYETKEAVSSRAVSPPVNTDQLQIPMQTDSAHFSQAPSVTSTVTPVQSTIRVEISGKRDVPSTKRPRSRLEQPEKTSLTEQINQKRYFLNEIFAEHILSFSVPHWCPTIPICGIRISSKMVRK